MSLLMDPQHMPHFTTEDLTPGLYAICVVAIVLPSMAMLARIYVRWTSRVPVGIDDGFASIAFLAHLASIVATLLLAPNHMLTYAPPTPAQAIFASKAAVSVGITYPLAVAFSKLSLLLLLRRIFGMRVMWFRIGWWLNIVLIFPCWLGVALTFGSLQVAGAALDPKIQGVSIPFVSFMNAATDATILILPIGTTLKLQLNRRSQISVIGIFAFGLLATSISLVRAIRSVQAANEGWYPRYTLYQSALTGAAETSIIFICSCLPMLGPLFAKFKQIAVHTVDKMTSKSSSQGGSRMTSRLGSRKPKSAVTLTSREYPDNARLNENVIYQEREFELHESNSADHVAHKQQHQVTTTPF